MAKKKATKNKAAPSRSKKPEKPLIQPRNITKEMLGTSVVIVGGVRPPKKRAREKARQSNARGNRIPLFVVKPGEATVEEISEVVQRALDEHFAEQRKARRKRGKRRE